MTNEYRAALQALLTAVEDNPPESIIDPGCYQCSEEMDAGEKAFMCSYHAAYYSAVALLARPEQQTQTLYVFLQQRPRDKQPFPLVYVDQQLAEAAPHRVTPVVAVDVPMLPSPPDAEATR